MKTRVLLTSLLTITVCGCGTVGPYTKATQIDNQQGTAILYRENSYLSGAISAFVSVDGDCVASLRNRSKTQISLSPGTHAVKVRGGLGTVSSKMTINVDGGKVSYVRVYPTPAYWVLCFLPVISWVTVPQFLLEDGNMNASEAIPSCVPVTYEGAQATPAVEQTAIEPAVSPKPDSPRIEQHEGIRPTNSTTHDETAVEQLKKLKELKDAGILTDDEYEVRRKALVDKL